MRALVHACAVTRGSTLRAGQRQVTVRRNRGFADPQRGWARPASLEGSRAELMPGTRDEQSRIAISTSGHRAEKQQQAFRLLNAT
jgi:hypothetical protein